MEPLLLTIAGSLIIILLSVIGYFIIKDQKKQNDTNDRLFSYIDNQRETTEKLNISITSLNGILLMMDERHNNLEKRFEEHKDVCRYNPIKKPTHANS
jgi:hypothetical protein